ncbi:kinase-like protein [Basidiobolus meristosporus CBS 931.73]|uniref:Kinase-like protein n=1 Tax=Basidiobolus meristosporus CBS 931.73 TaxID=1314790 RepID=A0A1Y1WY30_9FUNG|nr:kinase-like protein [Basidiobolus meristosporus CBS 931.73]|eukprot:ORX78228.1 kinase-like protein [Basidiobolus meristosporus CBS 931.73]
MTTIAVTAGFRKKRNFKNLELAQSLLVCESTTAGAQYSGNLSGVDSGQLYEQLVDLEIGLEFNLNLRQEDLKTLDELGSGNGGAVSKILHIPTKTITARKIVHIEAKTSVRKQIIRELQILHDCNSLYIVSFYGAFMDENDMKISICMEYIDKGSLDHLYRRIGPIPEPMIGSITCSVLHGLAYLYDHHRIIHRDVKLSNNLIDSARSVKLCDFGVSGILVDSIAETFVGTSWYMSRITGASYSVKSDVWSLGVSLLELSQEKFPFPQLSVFELLQCIVDEDLPTLPMAMFPTDFLDMVNLWLGFIASTSALYSG